MIGLKVAALVVLDVTVAVIAALDDLGQQIVLWSAAGAGILWGIVHIVRPGVKWLRSLFRSAEAFEQLPEWMAMLEAEHARLIAQLARIENHQRAFGREMGVQVRGEPRADRDDQDYDIDIEDGQRLSGPR